MLSPFLEKINASRVMPAFVLALTVDVTNLFRPSNLSMLLRKT